MSNAIRASYVSRADYRRRVAEEPGRFERIDGRIVAMAPERASHNRLKQSVWLALRNAVQTAGLSCEVFGDGMTVEIGEDHDYEPDGVLRCGPPLDGGMVAIPDPVAVAEVLSPSTARNDLFRKLVDYFHLPSVQH
jgi:Uma2 family endonuclease